MLFKQRLNAFVSLGQFITAHLNHQTTDDKNIRFHEELNNLIKNLHLSNPWFTPDFITSALKGIAFMLEEKMITNWANSYSIEDENNKAPKQVAVIMAGNIPMVGFHDALCVLISGHKLLAKLSSDDNQLIPFLFKILISFENAFDDFIKIEDGFVKNADAFIATGSDNSARYFESYFGKYPNIIRKNRSSVAILAGDESEESLQNLGKDVFTYFGLGCRNVSLLYLPSSMSPLRILDAFNVFAHLRNHNKYINNYDYRKAVALLNNIPHFDSGFLLLFENNTLHAPIGTLNYTFYENDIHLQNILAIQKEQIQCITGKNYSALGSAQYPTIFDYADGVDTMNFLLSLN